LTVTLQSEIESGKSSKSLQKIILDAPTWTDAELQDYHEARACFNLGLLYIAGSFQIIVTNVLSEKIWFRELNKEQFSFSELSSAVSFFCN
jgi:hypothetical protein